MRLLFIFLGQKTAVQGEGKRREMGDTGGNNDKPGTSPNPPQQRSQTKVYKKATTVIFWGDLLPNATTSPTNHNYTTISRNIHTYSTGDCYTCQPPPLTTYLTLWACQLEDLLPKYKTLHHPDLSSPPPVPNSTTLNMLLWPQIEQVTTASMVTNAQAMLR